MPDLSRKRERMRLAVRREPHWHKLDTDAHLGFRAGAETWIARYRDRTGQRHYSALSVPVDADDAFVAAKKLAEKWFKQMGGSAKRSATRATVRKALEAYLDDLQRHRRADAAALALSKFSTVLWDDRLAEIELERATRDDFEEWRDRITKGRAPRTVNRYVRAVKAGLNKAHSLGHVGNPAAWDLAMLSDEKEDDGESAAVFLTPEQRKAIRAKASLHAGDFLRGLELTGARPKELAAAKVADFDGESLRLAHRKGKPAKLRVRYTVLSDEGAKFFARMAKDKLPQAPLFTEDGEQPWRRHVWAKQIRAAIEAHHADCKPAERIPAGASAYSFRHARISELLQVHSVDPLTVAAQTGTSLAMIEKYYFRFLPNAMKQKLAAVKDSA